MPHADDLAVLAPICRVPQKQKLCDLRGAPVLFHVPLLCGAPEICGAAFWSPICSFGAIVAPSSFVLQLSSFAAAAAVGPASVCFAPAVCAQLLWQLQAERGFAQMLKRVHNSP